MVGILIWATIKKRVEMNKRVKINKNKMIRNKNP